jgi:lysozyme
MRLRRSLGVLLIVLALFVIIGVLISLGVWIPNYPSTANYPVRGVDVSHHQGTIDWNAAKAAGVTFAYIKATEGTQYQDPAFVQNWSGAGASGIVRGGYHFFSLDTSGEKQAENFLRVAPVDPNTLPPAIDLEFSGYNQQRRPSHGQFAKELSAFVDAVTERYKKPPAIYTTSEFRRQYLRSMPIECLWIREVLTRPRMEANEWIFWQFSGRGRVRGIGTFVDLNVFNGSAAEFDELVKTRR